MQDVSCDGRGTQCKKPSGREGTEDHNSNRKRQNTLYTGGLGCPQFREVLHAGAAGSRSGKQRQELQRVLNQRKLTVSRYPQVPALKHIEQKTEESSRQGQSKLPDRA